jgi:TonB family protein
MTTIIAVAWLLIGQGGCAQAISDSGMSEVCLAEQQLQKADAAPRPEQTRLWREAAEHAHRGASAAQSAEIKAAAAELLARLHDDKHLNEPDREQSALLDLISLRPADLTLVDRFARLLERIGLPEAAEDALLSAHRRQPQDIEPLRLLAQFYARRVTALHRAAEPLKTENTSAAIPQPDEHGIYKVGGPIPAPTRLDRVQYPQEARDAGIQGVVILEVVIDERGRVGDTKVLRSIPLLDQPAIEEAGRWQFAQTMVNGQPVKVRMTITQNFTLK